MKSMTQVMQNLVKPYINNEDTKIGLRIDQLTASKIGFDGTPIGYSATKTQAAIEEADGKIDDETTAREELSDYVAKTGVKNIARSYAGYALGTNSGDPIYTNEIAAGILSLAEIEPNATYIISKTSSGDRFRVAGFNSNDINDSSIRGTDIWASPNASTVTTYEYTNTAGYKYLAICFNASSSTTIDAVQPMVREKVFEDNTDYEPYAMTNSDLTGSALNEHENGAVNICPNTATTPASPVAGITYTVNSDRTVNASGTATGVAVLTVASGITFKKGVYKISGTPSGGNIDTGYAFYLQRNSDYSTIATDAANTSGLSDTFKITDETTVYNLNILVRSGYAISGTITFKPMITRVDYPFSDYAHYVPYAKSNRELTEWNNNYIYVPSSASTIKDAILYVAKACEGKMSYGDSISGGGVWDTHNHFSFAMVKVDNGAIQGSLVYGANTLYMFRYEASGGGTIATCYSVQGTAV